MTLEERAKAIIDAQVGFTFDRHDLADHIATAIREAIEADRRTRPTLVGAPMDDESLADARKLYEEIAGIRLARINSPIDQQIRGGMIKDRTLALGQMASDFLDHIAFLESLLHDLQEEGSAYERGRRDGYRQATEEAEIPMSPLGPVDLVSGLGDTNAYQIDGAVLADVFLAGARLNLPGGPCLGHPTHHWIITTSGATCQLCDSTVEYVFPEVTEAAPEP